MKKVLVVLLSIFIASAVFAGQGHEKHCTHENCKNCPCQAEKKEVEGQLKKIWGEVRTKLTAGDTEGALVFFDDASKEGYRKTFAGMEKKDVDGLFSKRWDIRLDDLHGDAAVCIAVRSGEEVNMTYPVSFVRNANGQWKIKSF